MDVFTVDSKRPDTATDKVPQKVLVLFSSYYFADKADKMLGQYKVSHQLMPVPSELSSSCGLSIGIKEEYIKEVLHIFEVEKITPSHMYYYEKGKEPIEYVHTPC
ncbi:DUF3343 domain-containing protein [Veillonella sp. VA142]|uniref:DUF3343 domain-containing protein n=1 Tax=Veillonella sp. VA142 TaxID=741834 RepID=UPI000F8C351D|nr:DUF3343 domain-containing protein [Veillonella sp. VA142]